jgi:hypothetical protein
MNYAQLVQAVGDETNRPDLVGEINQSVLEATLMAHTVENFYKDIQEATVVFDQPLQYLQQLDTSDLPFFRNMAYIRKTNPTATGFEQTNTIPPGPSTFPPNQWNFLKRVDIGDILDSYGYEKRDVWYQAGSQINIKSSTSLQYVTVGWYKYPNLDVDNFTSWIANELPFVIIYRACASVHAKISEDKAYAMYMRPPVPGRGDESGGLFYQQLAILKRNNILAGEG